MTTPRFINADDIYGTLDAMPGYKTGRFYLPFGADLIQSSGANPTAGSIRLLPGYVRQKTTIDTLGLNVTTLAAAGNVQAAVYAADPTSHLPTGLPLASTASMSTGATGIVSSAAAAQLDGLIWFASNCDNATAVFASLSSATAFASRIIGDTSLNNILRGGAGMLGFSVPSTFGTWLDLTGSSVGGSPNLTPLIAVATLPIVGFKPASVP